MKKTVRINISGLVFNIDEDAFDKLKDYLNSITKKFLNTNEGNEIIADVEARIAELFQERIGDRKEVINLFDVEYIIETMGEPEDFEEIDETEPASEDNQSKKSNRRIYRNTDNKVLGGLSSGIAAYFGVDPIIIRVLFVLMTLFYGTSLLIYILLWIIIPEAKTRSQKLEMKGQDINLSNIETSIKKEFTTVKTNFSKWQKTGSYDKLRSSVGNILNIIWSILSFFAKLILIIVGISFFISGIALLGTMTGLFFFNDTLLSPFSWNNVPFSIHEFASLFTDNFNARVGIIASYLLVLIPLLSIIYLGLKFIFRFKQKNRYIGVYAGALWLVSIIVLIFASIKVGYGMRADENISQSFKIETPNNDTLFVKLFDHENTEYWSKNRERFGWVYVEFEENGINLSGQPKLTITKSNTSSTNLRIKKHSSGKNSSEALQLAKNMKYNWQQDDSILYFEQYFDITGEKKVREQYLEAELQIPLGKIIYLGQNIERITSFINNVQDLRDYEMTQNYWIMTENGLSLLNEYYKDLEEENKTKTEIKEGNNTNLQEEIKQMKDELDSM